MTSILPITLIGDNLGKRHKQINDLVKEAYDAGNEVFENIIHTPEKSAIDRLFKIDLASKHRNVDYIINNLKDGDMLYVSRALKSKWLLKTEHKSIINPANLEDHVYPYMITTAITKMKHWIHLNLTDEKRLEEFYTYYSEKDFELAMKFLFKSSKEFIKATFLDKVNKITPKHFKLLCEKCPEVAKTFFDLVATDENVKSQYTKNEKEYYDSMKSVLKTDTNLYLDITEKYFNYYQHSRFSPIATKFIMSHQKERFWKKPELYTAWLLNTRILSESLTVEECKKLVETLARAEYLNMWFDYKNVEPLIKRLKPDERAAFKKKVFVDKNIGDKVKKWPYEPPSAPTTEYLGQDLFEDSQHEPYEYAYLGNNPSRKRLLKKKCRKLCAEMCDIYSCQKVKTLLDKLFDEFRFVSFEKALYELKKRILAESSAQNRQYIMLVLISKTGGRDDAIAALMELLARHSNEPANLRATVIRSLVKRAFIWRLPEDTWKKLLEFGQGLGLDGRPPDANCVEGLHSVFIRSLLQKGTCDDVIFKAFLEQFSDLSNYTLTPAEKTIISEALPKMLLSAAKEKKEVDDAIPLIEKLIEFLRTYKIAVENYPDLLPTVVYLADKNYSACSNLLENLFNSKIGRKAFFRYTYKLIKTDASHINALKHDISVLDFDIFYDSCINCIKFEQFLRKIAIYFNESEGLVMQYRNKLKEKEHDKLIGRPLAILLGSELGTYLLELDMEEKVETKVLRATVRANAHLTRPTLDIDDFGWRKAGVKMISNKLITCPFVNVKTNIEKLLEWKRTARLAFVLSCRTENVTDVLVKVSKLRPTIGIKLGLKLMTKQGDDFDTEIWDLIKPLIEKIDFNKNSNQFYVRNALSAVDSMPTKIKTDYNIMIFKALENQTSDSFQAMPFLCRIEQILSNVPADFIETILKQFLNKDFVLDKITKTHDVVLCNSMYLRIIYKYIYLSKSEEDQKHRFETFGNILLDRLTEVYKVEPEVFYTYLDEILLNFKNTKVFMSSEYVSCLPVIEKTINWMQTILPIEEHFEKYAQIHLTMLYYKAVRQTAKQAPEVFANERRKLKDGVKVVGNLFGKHIAKEVKELTVKYFESIIYIYKDALDDYLVTYYNYVNSSDFLASIIRGIVQEGGDEVRLGMYLLKEKYYSIKDEDSAEISKSFMEVKDLKNKFFAYAEIYT